MTPTVETLRMNLPGEESGYDILVGRGLLGVVERYLDLSGKVLVLTDDGVPEAYAQAVASKASQPFVLRIPQGEASKSVDTYLKVLDCLVGQAFTRHDKVVAVGGGVVGDLAGFVAATYMRGIVFYNIPTTLLSQVDSSIGGKTAIDFGGVKNIVGAFYQPHRVVIDLDTLDTLPARQLHNGLVEAIKMAATGDAELFELIERTSDLRADLPEIVWRSLRYKRDIVQRDPKESSLRRVLNFGHTLGHAVEASSEGRLLHGEAVALGMLPFSSPEVRQRIEAVLVRYGLPLTCGRSADELMDYLRRDKKARGDQVTVVTVETLGRFEFRTMSLDEFKTLTF